MLEDTAWSIQHIMSTSDDPEPGEEAGQLDISMLLPNTQYEALG